jgi:hypothetical protein
LWLSAGGEDPQNVGGVPGGASRWTYLRSPTPYPLALDRDKLVTKCVQSTIRVVRYHGQRARVTRWDVRWDDGQTYARTRNWYAAELLGEEFGSEIRSYSPIKVEEVTPRGGRRFSLAFYHATYPEGVRDKVYDLEALERNATFLLARSTSHRPARLLLIYTVTSAWLNEHFGAAVPESVDPQEWLARNA